MDIFIYSSAVFLTMLHAWSSVGFIIPDHKCTSIFVHEVMIHIRLRDITVSVYYDQGLIFSKTNCICKQKPLFAITLTKQIKGVHIFIM